MGSIPLVALALPFLLVIHTLMMSRARCSSFPNATTCIQSEREALLKFKRGLIDDSRLLSSWVGDDCCSWKGVMCSKRTGHVVRLDLRSACVAMPDPIFFDPFEPYPDHGNCSLRGEIHPSLMELKQLKYLDLSWNNFSYPGIPSSLGSLSKLVYLNLSNALFSGKIPLQLGNLSSLQYLDLNNLNVFDNHLPTLENLKWVSSIPSLKHLDLSGIFVVNAEGWLQSVAALPSLMHLGLADCFLPSTAPMFPVNFTSLEFLDLSNTLGSEIPQWLLNLSSLQHLRLSGSFLFGASSFPAEIIDNNMKLAFLDLSGNSLRGELPKNLSNLPDLFALNLAGNNLTGDISVVLSKSALSGFPYKLRYLDLSQNRFSGHLGDDIGEFKSVEYIYLHDNSIEGPIPEGVVQLASLKIFDLSKNNLTGVIPESIGGHTSNQLLQLRLLGNRLTGSIPGSIGKMSNLVFLDLSDNQLSGVVSQLHFANLTNLIYLDISSNNELAVEVSSTWVPPFQLERVFMSNCKVGPQFPTWLQSQSNVDFLGFSNTSISGIIPDWFYNISFNIRYLDLSGNELTGQIPKSLCKMKGVRVLDLSNNQLSGRLPRCWWKSLSQLREITLGNNQLSGPLPTFVCSLQGLRFLGLHNNHFYGNLPKCLTSMDVLQVLDLGRNKFGGRIPPLNGRLLPFLSVLSLEFNSFGGDIPSGICQLADLGVLNLAHNNLSGSIPFCFGNLTAMSDQDHVPDYYSFGVEVHMKSLTQEYTTTLPYLFSIDLSDNNLAGQIPQGLSQLYNLKNLNLSQNQLIGRIPSTIADLKNLESLDLSINRFSGPVPPRLSELNFLSCLNLSYNQLSGPIPSGPQLTTFKNDSYLGNDALCGPPLSRSCWGDHEPSDVHKQQGEDSDGKDEYDTLWYYAGIAPGFTTGFLGVCGSLYFKHSWRQSFFLWSDHVLTQMLVTIQISLARLLEFFRKCRENSTS